VHARQLSSFNRTKIMKKCSPEHDCCATILASIPAEDHAALTHATLAEGGTQQAAAAAGKQDISHTTTSSRSSSSSSRYHCRDCISMSNHRRATTTKYSS
jgi:hypothetical protein